MRSHPGRREGRDRSCGSSGETVSASGQGAAAIGRDVSGIVAIGADSINVQQQNLFLNIYAAGLATPAVDEDRFRRGTLVVGDVPQEPPAFQSREHLVRELGVQRARTSVIYAVTGMRGVGKTQIAAAYARSCIDAGWRLVAWVEAGDAGSVLAGLGAVATSLGMNAGRADAAGVAAMVRHWLEADGHDCLVVFDNATDIDRLRPFLPAAGAAQALITSTRQAAGNLGSVVPVDVFTESEALAFLSARTKRNDEAGARQLATELGCLPLGLAQAAAVIAQQRLSYDRYLERLQAIQLDRYLERVEGDPYPRCAAQAVLLSLQAAEAADPDGGCRGVMDLVAILSPAGVSRPILHAAAAYGVVFAAARLGHDRGNLTDEPAALRASGADSVIGRLAEWSLLTFSVDGSVIAAHRLIKRVARERCMADGSYPALAELAAHLLANLADQLGGQVWEHPAEVSELVGHIIALCDHTAGHLGDDTAASRMIRDLRQWAVWQLNTMADRPAVAISIAQPLAAESGRVLGTDHPDTLMARNNLATAYQAAGQLNEATSLFERTLADRERVLGADHAMTLTSRNNLAGAYREAGRLDDAVSLYEGALAGRERVLGRDHPETLAARSNLGLTYQQAGRHEDAVPLLERALADSERALGATHPRTLTLRNNLASAYLETGRMETAAALLEAVLADRERVLGSDHPETLASRLNLAFAHRVTGRPNDAISLYERTLADSERVLGADHPGTLTALINLAVAYQDDGRLDEAIPAYERAIADSERVLGADHPNTLGARIALATSHQTAGRTDEAIQLLEQARADAERLLSSGDARTLTMRTHLAGAYQTAGRLNEAIPLFERTLGDSERLLGDDHPRTRTSRANLACAYLMAGRQNDAVAQGEQVVADNLRLLGSDHPETLSARNNLAIAYGAAGQLDQAIALLERNLADSNRVLGAEHAGTLQPRANLARAYLDTGQPSKAIPLLEDAIKLAEQTLGDASPGTLESRNNLAIAYLRAGRRETAIPLLERALADSERVLGADHQLAGTVRDNLAAAKEQAI